MRLFIIVFGRKQTKVYGGNRTFMERSKIERINELAKKSREEGLTADEKLEQQVLRLEYLESVKRNFRATLENIEIQE